MVASGSNGGVGAPVRRDGLPSRPSQCQGSALAGATKTLQTDNNRNLLQNFAVLAADVRRELSDQEKSNLLPLFDYFAGNIIQSGIATNKSSIIQESGPPGGYAGAGGNPGISAEASKRKELAKSAFIEVQANGLCGMSGFETCQRQNGQAIQNNANTTSPINTPDLNPVNTTHGGSTAGASSLSTRRSW